MTSTSLRDTAASDPDAALVAPPRPPPPSALRKRLWLLLKLCVAGSAFTFILSRQPWSELTGALARLTPGAFVLASLFLVSCIPVGTLRWRLLMHAYGATRLPPFSALLHVYFVGSFYNTYVPGALGGDLLRGVVTRRSFDTGGVTSGLTIVLVERALGMLGVVGVFSLVAPFGADETLRRTFLPYCALGLVAIAALVAGVALGRRLQGFAPKRIAPLLAALPQLSRVAPFVAACLLSLVTQSLVALTGHVLLSSIYPEARIVDSFIAAPLAAAAAFLPVSVAGAGPRDLMLVALYVALGVPRAAGAAVALAMLASMLLVTGIGGVLQFLAPLTVEDPGPRAP